MSSSAAWKPTKQKEIYSVTQSWQEGVGHVEIREMFRKMNRALETAPAEV